MSRNAITVIATTFVLFFAWIGAGEREIGDMRHDNYLTPRQCAIES